MDRERLNHKVKLAISGSRQKRLLELQRQALSVFYRSVRLCPGPELGALDGELPLVELLLLAGGAVLPSLACLQSPQAG